MTTLATPLVNEQGALRPSLWRWLARHPIEAGATAFILAGAAYLRLAELEFGQFLYDDVTLWNIVRGVADQPQLLTRGMISSFGIDNGPFQAYLLLPGALAAPSPLGAYYIVAVLNVVAVFLFWAFVRTYWGPRLALIAALLFAVNPWAVVFSRRLWGNDMLAPFNVLLTWSLCDLVRYGRRRDSVLPLFWLAIVIQLYVVALLHLALAALGLALGVRRLRLTYLVGGLALFAALTLPYIVSTVLPSLDALSHLMTGVSRRSVTLDATSISFLFHIVSSEGYQAFANHAGILFDAGGGLPRAVSLLTATLLALGLATAAAEAVRHCRRGSLAAAAPYILSLTMILLPVLLLVRHTAPVYPYYLLTGFPMPFLLIALALRQTWRALDRLPALRGSLPALWPRCGLAAVTVLVVATHVLLSQPFLAAIQAYAPTAAYGMPLRYTLDIAATTRRLANDLGSVRVYIGGPDDHDTVLYRALKPDLPGLVQFDSVNTFVRPTKGTGSVLYVLSSEGARVGQTFAARFPSAAVAALDIPGPGLRYSFFAVTAADIVDLFPEALDTPLAITFDSRVRLDSYAVEPELHPGEPHQLTLRWTLLGGDSRLVPAYYAYMRLVDDSHRVRQTADLLFYDAAQWQPGEELIWWRSFPVPADLEPGVYSYLVGLYTPTPTSYRNVPAVDAAGRSIGDSVRLGTLVVRPPAPPAPAHGLSVAFGPRVALAGYDLAAAGAVPGGPLEIDLYWHALAKPGRDYTVFVHFLGSDGQIVAQHDSRPVSGRYPTTVWLPGDTIVDRHTLPLPASLTPGRYTIATGLYDLATGERLGGPGFAATFPIAVE